MLIYLTSYTAETATMVGEILIDVLDLPNTEWVLLVRLAFELYLSNRKNGNGLFKRLSSASYTEYALRELSLTRGIDGESWVYVACLLILG